MGERTCSVGECENVAHWRGWCGKHYRRWKRYGSPARTSGRVLNHNSGVTLTERVWRHVSRVNGCWQWTGKISDLGYGLISVGGRTVSAHRTMYELIVEPVPAGLVLDHLCRNRACVNPSHLEPVTQRENIRRGIKGVLTTHCPRGHPYDAANTRYDRKGHRFCIQCGKDKAREWRQRKLAS